MRSSPAISGYILLAGAIVLNIIVQGKSFFSASYFSSIMSNNGPLILAAIAQTVVVLAGGIDLSVGSIMALVNAVAIVLANEYGWSVGGAWTAALIAGTLVGVVNGFIVAYVRVDSLLATFATMSIVGGVGLLVLPKPGGSVPRAVYGVYHGYLLGLPAPIWIILAIVLLWALINRYPIGRYIRAVGGNERSAYASGIRTTQVKFFAFVFSAFVTSIAGLSLTALMAAGDPRIGLPFTLNSIAAIILGGTILSGGWGSVGGSIAGALFLALVSNIVFYTFNFLVTAIPGFNVTTYYQQLLSNFIVIFGLASTVLTNRRNKTAKA